MNFQVVGKGAVGSLMGCYFHLANVPVSFIARAASSHPTFLRPSNQPLAIPIETLATRSSPFERMLICTKAFSIQPFFENLVRDNPNLISDSTVVFLCNNGLGVAEEFESLQIRLPRILHVINTHGCLLHDKNSVEHTGIGQMIIGSPNSDVSDTLFAEVDDLARAVPDLRIKVERDPKTFATWMVKKWVMNCTINPLTALLGCKNGELLRSRSLLDVLLKECLVFVKENYPHVEIDEKTMMEDILRVLRSTAKNKSSMLVDVESNRRTEILYLNGRMVTTGEDTEKYPFNSFLVRLISSRQPNS
ncbi:ketopantoate reductase PanE/ApbA C terminal-domain-containing protein [Cladochytrium replicatum]|nr:ketopantoate reductase PanE/ApbA C terminal-domain-containing protein [Cladochytrium replicatum]